MAKVSASITTSLDGYFIGPERCAPAAGWVMAASGCTLGVQRAVNLCRRDARRGDQRRQAVPRNRRWAIPVP